MAQRTSTVALVAFILAPCLVFSDSVPSHDADRDVVVQLLQTDLSMERQQGHHVTNINANKDVNVIHANETLKVHKGPPTATSTTMSPSLGNATGMSMNAAGDLDAFLAAVIANTITGVVCLVIFSLILRPWYPILYSDNVSEGKQTILKKPDDSKFGWMRSSLDLKTQDIIDSAGLDQAMLIEFCNLGMRLMGYIGVPMICIMGPMHWAFGGLAAGDDYLSYLSFGNVENGSWLYWVHAPIVWAVVFMVQRSLYQVQKNFLDLRFAWLKRQPTLCTNTILIEGIPPECQSDAKLKEKLNGIVPGAKVDKAYVVKDTSELKRMVDKKAILELQARAQAEKNPTAAEQKKVEIVDLTKQIQAERMRINEASAVEGGVNLSRGFVTFSERIHAAIAVQLECTQDRTEWVMSSPPEPSDILWNDLTQDPSAETGRQLVGNMLVVGLFFAYMPMVLGITNVAKMINMGPLQPVWQGLAPTMGLQFMVAFLPTFLMIIFSTCFTLRASVFAQHKVQSWYFWFQVFFVILATAVGQDFWGFVDTLATAPFEVFDVLARTMPYSTHFYMNFLVLQWVTHTINLMRTTQLAKFRGAKALYNCETTAKQLAEPEDQDYYGMGSRCSRFTINLCIGIVYGTLSPPINLLTFVNFAVCRLVYGYLIPFAETKKPDLGGVYWVTMLKHVFVGNIIYCVLMIGVLTQRSDSWGPMMIATPSLFYVISSMRRFETAFSWEKLPQEMLIDSMKDQKGKKTDLKGSYEQPELMLEK